MTHRARVELEEILVTSYYDGTRAGVDDCDREAVAVEDDL